MKSILTAAALAVLAAPALANPTGAANDLVTILASEQACELAIDQDALGAYFVESGIDQEPGLLAYIESMTKMRAGEAASATTCTMARSRATAIGILSD